MTYNDLTTNIIKDLHYGFPKEIEGKNAPTVMATIHELKEAGIEKKLNILLEVNGNTITKYPTLTYDQMIEWNNQYYSEERIKIRERVNKKLGRA